MSCSDAGGDSRANALTAALQIWAGVPRLWALPPTSRPPAANESMASATTPARIRRIDLPLSVPEPKYLYLRSRPTRPRPSYLLSERCATQLRPTRVSERPAAAGHDRWSRDGDSNPGPAHYEQSEAERCAHRPDRQPCADHPGTETPELSAELARRGCAATPFEW